MTAQHMLARPMQPYSRHFTSSDGVALHARQWREAASVCLLIHGFGEGGYVWNDFVAELSAATCVLAMDLRGHGDSQWDMRRHYDVQTHADDVMRMLTALDLERVLLVGHSMGGDIAIRVAASCPERVTGLAIVDFGPDIDAAATDHILAEFNADSRTYRSVSEYAARLEARYPFAAPALLSRLANHALRMQADGSFQLKRDPTIGCASPSRADNRKVLWTLLRQLSCPTVVARGVASSVLAPPVADRMIATLRHGHLVVVPRAGHAVMIDNPGGFAAAIMPFLSQALSA